MKQYMRVTINLMDFMNLDEGLKPENLKKRCESRLISALVLTFKYL